MMFMRTILALSLAAFALAVPVAQPQEPNLVDTLVGIREWFYSSNTQCLQY
jgi:hypothetical protein